MDQITNDIENYAAMSVPHASTDEVQAEMNAFFEGVRALRQKHKLREVSVIVETAVNVDGEGKDIITSAHYGNSYHALQMATYYLKKESDHVQNVLVLAYSELERAKQLDGQLEMFGAATEDVTP